VCLLSSFLVRSQEVYPDRRPRLLLDTEVGSLRSLGYKFPSTAFGPAVEIPLAKHFELQASSAYSPDRKVITNDGHSFKVTGSAMRFIHQRFGLVAGIERSWLWTSQFDKSAWHPSAGIVIRNDYWGPGRLYLNYVLPTGCVWATPSNPCQIQSNRMQGFEVRQDIRSSSYMRWGFKSGIYHFCDQANPNAPQAGRHCHWAATALGTVTFEFHLGHGPRVEVFDAVKSDTF
jgi:hypothetical protein